MSRNLVSIRLLKEMGVKPVIDYVQNFGFTPEKNHIPNNLTLALGSMQATPLEVATGFAVFANGGYRVEPFYIDRIEGPGGQIVYTAEPHTVCAECSQPIYAVSDADSAKQTEVSADARAADARCRRTRATSTPAERVISPQVCFLMNDIMREVITRGTGRRALALGRTDLRGKTGTTDTVRRHLVQRLQRQPGGERLGGHGRQSSARRRRRRRAHRGADLGGLHARGACAACRKRRATIPDGIIEMKVNAATGGKKDADLDPMFEYFRADMLPTRRGLRRRRRASGRRHIDPTSPDTPQSGTDPIF